MSKGTSKQTEGTSHPHTHTSRQTNTTTPNETRKQTSSKAAQSHLLLVPSTLRRVIVASHGHKMHKKGYVVGMSNGAKAAMKWLS